MKSAITFAVALLLLSILSVENSSAQGCVAIRNMGCSGTTIGGKTTGFLQKGQFQVTANYRYFKSYKHFRGSHEEAERVENHTEVINKVHSLDLGLAYGVTNRFSVNLTLPYNHYDRSSLYEHYGNSIETNPDQKRFHTGSSGIGDMRLTGNYWLIAPEKAGKGNIAIGVGVKAPTGNAEVKDNFHKLTAEGNDTLVNKYVDQSIQLGDGGWGFSLETQGYYAFLPRLSAYFSGFYMVTPQEDNGVARQTVTTEYPKSIVNYFAVPDQFAARVGFGIGLFPEYGIGANIGGRLEGIASEDLIGGKGGYRRPGYVISVEPGLDWSFGDYNIALNVPVAVYRNRTQSVSDKAITETTGKFTQGDAAFADYLISLSASYRFGGKHEMMDMPKSSGTFKDVPATKN
jgi:hypothetical protein